VINAKIGKLNKNNFPYFFAAFIKKEPYEKNITKMKNLLI